MDEASTPESLANEIIDIAASLSADLGDVALELRRDELAAAFVACALERHLALRSRLDGKEGRLLSDASSPPTRYRLFAARLVLKDAWPLHDDPSEHAALSTYSTWLSTPSAESGRLLVEAACVDVMRALAEQFHLD